MTAEDVVRPRLGDDMMPCLWQVKQTMSLLCIPKAIAAPSSGQYWLLNRTTVLSPTVLLCTDSADSQSIGMLTFAKQLAFTACLEQTSEPIWVTTLLS